MAEFEEKLNAILGNPEAMGQIVSIAKALTTGGEESAAQASPPEPHASSSGPQSSPADPETPRQESASGQPDLSQMLGLLSGGGGDASSPMGLLGDLDPKLIQTALRLFSEYSATDDRKIALLAALKPFLKEERYAKVDKAIQIAKLSRMIRVAFQLFKENNAEGGGQDV